MITPRIKPSSVLSVEAPDDLFLVRQRKVKFEGYVQALAAMDKLNDVSELAATVVAGCL